MRIIDGERALRGRGAPVDVLLARPDRPRRCTLPITALRVMPPSTAAIWLAERPSDQSFLSSSTRSSVHDMLFFLPERAGSALKESPTEPGSAKSRPTHTYSPERCLEDCPPHEMSYLTIKMLQYGGGRGEESARHASTHSWHCVDDIGVNRPCSAHFSRVDRMRAWK